MAAATYKKKRQQKEISKKKRNRRIAQQEKHRQKKDRNVLDQYNKELPPVSLEADFRLTCLRKEEKIGKRSINIGGLVESCTWDDDGPVKTGSLTLQRPQARENEFPIRDGNMIRCDVRWGYKWKELWRMRVWSPDEDVTGISTFELADDLENAQESEIDVRFKKKKKGPHKNGWKTREMARQVMKKARIRPGKIAKTSASFDEYEALGKSPVDILTQLYTKEREQTGKQYVLRWQNGRLSILPLRRQKLLYTLRDQLLGATVGHTREPFATALTVTANIKRGDRPKRKVTMRIVHRKALKRYGFIHKKIELEGEMKSRKQVRNKAMRIMSKKIRKKTQKTVSVSHVGIPFIRRGDAVHLFLPEYGLSDKPRPTKLFKGGHESIFFVTAAHFSLSSGDFSMDLDFGTDDPIASYLEEQREFRDKNRRKKKREKHNKSRKVAKDKAAEPKNVDPSLDQVIVMLWKVVRPAYDYKNKPFWKAVPAGAGYMYTEPGPVGYRHVGISPNAREAVKHLDPSALFALFHEWAHVGQPELLFNKDAAEGWANNLANDAMVLWNAR